MPGILERLGSAGHKVISLAQSIKQTLGEVLGILERHDIVVEPEPAARDWGRVSTSEALEPEITSLQPYEEIPHEFYVRSDIPWEQPYAYQVTVYGRDRGTGQFRNQQLDITMASTASPEEIVNEVFKRFGVDSPEMFSEIFDAAVTGAWVSPDIEW